MSTVFKKRIGDNPRRYDAADAVVEDVAATGYAGDRGAVEQAMATAHAAADRLGRLVGMLHDRGMLSDDDVAAMLDYFEVAA